MLAENAPEVPAPEVDNDEPQTPHPVPARRILIVDDNTDAADLLSEALSLSGYETCVAYDGLSALALAAIFQPEMALLDLGLPGMNGFELATRLHATAGLETLKFIAITGYGMASDRRRAIESGFEAHILKPVEFPHLEQEIERLIGP